MYAILDIESTGGKFNEEGITEIAIYKFDGHDIVDQFASLINPERPIDPYVTKLTGINNKMLIRAPKFYEVAKRIIEITTDTVIVAHNAEFDMRMLQLEFDRLGFELEKSTLCTVELAQKLLPDAPSYSLGKLVRSLGIPITNRHRATGDALATVDLFKLLLNKDLDKNIIQSSLKRKERVKLPPNLKSLLDEIPSIMGVYYIYDANDTIIYVGKSKNVKTQINRHFTKTTRLDKSLRKEIQEIKLDKTGNELIAAIKEHEAVTALQPKLNRKRKKRLFNHAITLKKDADDYSFLQIKRVSHSKTGALTFASHKSATSFLEKLVQDHQLCASRTSLDTSCECCDSSNSTQSPISRDDHNTMIDQLIEHYSLHSKNAVVSGRGRTPDEKAVVYFKQGILQGYAFTKLQIQVVDQKILEQILIPVVQKEDGRHLTELYLRNHSHRYTIKKLDA